MANAIRIYSQGGSDVLTYESIDSPVPAAGEIAIRQSAVGLNYIDVYHRSGAYPITDFPAIIGLEGAGTVTALGEGVTQCAVGDRVAYAAPPMGAYADERVIPAHQVVKLPDDIEFDTAAAMMLQGLTVQYLIRQTYKVSSGETVLLHAAAGGVGLIASQWLNHLGVEVIGTVGTEEKAELARAHGCAHTILYREENIADRVREITDGKGVPVVYDSIGQSTLDASLDSLSPRGLMVSFGAASGPIESFNVGQLAAKGSLYLTRPSLMTYIADPANLQAMAKDLLDVVGNGAVKININQRYALADAAKAHDDLEARNTTGSTVLVPDQA
ncbi:MAG: quinone oxidoreductase [Gammaproteobacteria bacterium]|nr:quinone oxidoreductase [Gammaproteobacteria bacterium]